MKPGELCVVTTPSALVWPSHKNIAETPLGELKLGNTVIFIEEKNDKMFAALTQFGFGYMYRMNFYFL